MQKNFPVYLKITKETLRYAKGHLRSPIHTTLIFRIFQCDVSANNLVSMVDQNEAAGDRAEGTNLKFVTCY